MDRKNEIRTKNNARPEIAQETRKAKVQKGFGEQIAEWVDTIMPSRF